MSSLKRITWKAAENAPQEEPTCGTCTELMPYVLDHLSNAGRPVLGTCRYCSHMVLLSETRKCNFYKRLKHNGNENEKKSNR